VNSTAEPSKVREIKIQNDHLKKAVEQSRKLDLKGKGLPPAGQAGSSGAGSSSSLPPAPKQRPLQATIVNCSGSSQTGAQAAADARNAGFVVLSITTGNPMDQTQVLINSGSSRAEERVGSLPFNYTLLRGSVNPGSGDAVIYVGKDYGK
jgi:polyisoprenyl-teichoic acid--peptidoglycan teichoic acid transferase